MRPITVLSASSFFMRASFPDHTCRRNRGSKSFAAAIILRSANRSLGVNRYAFAVSTVGEKRRIFAGNEPGSEAFTLPAPFLCPHIAGAATVKRRHIEVNRFQRFIAFSTFRDSVYF